MDRRKFIVCIIFVFYLGIDRDGSVEAQNSQNNNNCNNGVCINIKSCPTLRSLVEHPERNASTTTFLRNSLCGYEDHFPYYPKVCCSLENESTTYTATSDTTPEPNFISGYQTDSTIKLPSQTTCGRSNASHDRIDRGNFAELGAWPWMAVLGYQYYDYPVYVWRCGGTLISDRYVLTAAHCLVDFGVYCLSVVRLGELNLNPRVKDGAAPKDFKISIFIKHEEFDSKKLINDIALLKLEETVIFNQFIQPICLPILSHLNGETYVQSRPYLAGWSSTILEQGTDDLMEVQVPVIEHSECARAYAKKQKIIEDLHLCAGEPGKDSCQGDSGGPLMMPNGTQYYLVGVVSSGHKCGATGYPGIYARVTSYVEWIMDTINKN